jgi:hypothetical protein
MNINPPPGDHTLINSAIEALEQGEVLLNWLDDEQFTRKLPVAYGASIGGHYRHCLDHFRGVLGAAVLGDLNYDQRARGTPVENDRQAALAATRELRQELKNLDPACLSRPFSVTCKSSNSTDGSQAAFSTVGREIMYSISHAVHHYALMGMMLGIMGLKMPAGFGVAPSTLEHQARMAQAAA